jgi:hypothetical protein
VRGSLRKELADGVGMSGMQTAYDGTWLAIRNRRTNSSMRINSGPAISTVPFFGSLVATSASGAVIHVVSLRIEGGVRAVSMTLNPDKLSRWSAAETDEQPRPGATNKEMQHEDRGDRRQRAHREEAREAPWRARAPSKRLANRRERPPLPTDKVGKLINVAGMEPPKRYVLT